jgi:hypothetical protein
MSAQESEQTNAEQDTKTNAEQDTKTSDEQDAKIDEEGQDGDQQQESSDVPTEPSEEGKEEVRKMAKAYEEKPTAVMPGTDRTITGTAVNEWLDDEGNPKFGDPDEHPFADDNAEDDDSSKEASEAESKDTGEDESKDTADEG